MAHFYTQCIGKRYKLGTKVRNFKGETDSLLIAESLKEKQINYSNEVQSISYFLLEHTMKPIFLTISNEYRYGNKHPYPQRKVERLLKLHL